MVAMAVPVSTAAMVSRVFCRAVTAVTAVMAVMAVTAVMVAMAVSCSALAVTPVMLG
jgi:hypothetical protein